MNPKVISYRETAEFAKELKKLTKRFRSLPDDLETAKKNAIELFHLREIDNQSVFAIKGECTEKIMIYKLKKFACKALKGRGNKSGIRIIYAYEPESALVTWIEIYFKADRENEDRERIREYIKSGGC